MASSSCACTDQRPVGCWCGHGQPGPQSIRDGRRVGPYGSEKEDLRRSKVGLRGWYICLGPSPLHAVEVCFAWRQLHIILMAPLFLDLASGTEALLSRWRPHALHLPRSHFFRNQLVVGTSCGSTGKYLSPYLEMSLLTTVLGG